MEEELNLIIEMSKESMKNSIDYLEKKLLNIRAGKANPQLMQNQLILLMTLYIIVLQICQVEYLELQL